VRASSPKHKASCGNILHWFVAKIKPKITENLKLIGSPQHPVASVIGFLQGKSAIAMARLHGKGRNFSGEPFQARG